MRIADSIQNTLSNKISGIIQKHRPDRTERTGGEGKDQFTLSDKEMKVYDEASRSAWSSAFTSGFKETNTGGRILGGTGAGLAAGAVAAGAAAFALPLAAVGAAGYVGMKTARGVEKGDQMVESLDEHLKFLAHLNGGKGKVTVEVLPQNEILKKLEANRAAKGKGSLFE
ncbi:MAG: hypothetical protein LWY06_10305 [Firmicutes bacterium]|nr:hypothetical protein [Bacillota bacterium]